MAELLVVVRFQRLIAAANDWNLNFRSELQG
jgi:hypothetical protein